MKASNNSAFPKELVTAGYIWMGNICLFLLLSLTHETTGVAETTSFAIFWIVNLAVCPFLGIAARKLGKSWPLYGVLTAIAPAATFFGLFKLWSDARIKMWDASDS